jgi:glutamate-1-semialdehyde 2,1-aminomutase
MAGHSPDPVIRAVREQAGLTTMLPTEDAAWVGEELARRFGLPYWQFSLTATDANRWLLRMCRQVTGRPKVAVFNWCYHGSVDEAFVTLDGSREGNVGPMVDPAETTRVAEFNEVDSVEAALARGDVACLLMEPALTNIGIVLPEPGFLEAVRELCTRHGTLLIIDETHTFSAGPGGCTAAWGLEPDAISLGQVDRRRRADRRLRRERRAGGAHRGGGGRRLRGHRRRRRHARRQRAVARRRARRARRGADPRGIRAHVRAP